LANFCANSLANGWTIFRYEFEHFNEGNTRAMNPLMPFKGATHGTELAFVFDVNIFLLPWRRTNVDKQARQYIILKSKNRGNMQCESANKAEESKCHFSK
jgi:hypothetical protein